MLNTSLGILVRVAKNGWSYLVQKRLLNMMYEISWIHRLVYYSLPRPHIFDLGCGIRKIVSSHELNFAHVKVSYTYLIKFGIDHPID